jgi:hypothetical protein
MAVNFSDAKIFFYCLPTGPNDKAAYQHSIVCLAEGLREMGVEFYSNINYWPVSPEQEKYLFRHDPEVTPDDCSIVVLNNVWFDYGHPFPNNIFHLKRKYVIVYLDFADGIKTHSWNPEFRQVDFIFKTHYNSKCKYPSNCSPAGFGLSNRILSETSVLPIFLERQVKMLVNFRATHLIRELVCQEFPPRFQNVLPVDNTVDRFDNPPEDAYAYLQWVLTGRRHYPTYYKRLKESVACACFGGNFITNWPRDPVTPVSLILTRLLNKLGLRSGRILQWDSWHKC